ncbi:MAG: enoyl-CoA hydratase-related protein, partial [Ginsengibacter sp.]
MIYKFFPDENFIEEANKIALVLASMPTKGLAYTKLALNKSSEQNLRQQLQTEDELQQEAAQTKDFNEGVTAFLEKRKPKFNGE